VSAKDISDELAALIADDLRERYSLDDDDLRALGARLAAAPAGRTAANLEFAERFVEEHRATFDRLGE
jgi:hypothetical protein